MDADGRVNLTRGQHDYRFTTSGEEIVIGPIARKHVKRVDAVYDHRHGQRVGRGDASALRQQARVDFTWEWMPDDIGQLFPLVYGGDQQAIATLENDGSEWRVLRIDPRRGGSRTTE